jgi:hypothetical protein
LPVLSCVEEGTIVALSRGARDGTSEIAVVQPLERTGTALDPWPRTAVPMRREEARPMTRRLRRRFWWEAGLAGLTGLLLLLTLITPQWIEVLFEAEPDGGSGALEWAIVGTLAIVTAGLSLTAWFEGRRAVPRHA